MAVARWPERGCLGGGGGGQEDIHLALDSEPDLITAHTGYPIDVAQHWETDEASAGEKAAHFWLQKLWPAVVASHGPVCWLPCCSRIWSEVVELQVGWEGHVLPRQAHVVEFQVVGVTRDQ